MGQFSMEILNPNGSVLGETQHIDLIDSINPFREGFDIASKALDTPLLQQIQSAMVAQRVQMTEEEALVLCPRIKRFTAQEGRPPNPNSPDDLERRLAEAHAYIRTKKALASADVV